MSELVRILNWAAKERCRIADENRKNGVSDPLNDMMDEIQAMLDRGEYLITKPLRKSQKHKKRKEKDLTK